MTAPKNYYQLLSLNPDLSCEEIKKQLKSIEKYSQKIPQNIRVAYRVLTEHKERSVYNKKLMERYDKNTPIIKTFSDVLPHYCPFCKRPFLKSFKPGDICPQCQTPLSFDKRNGERRKEIRLQKSGEVLLFLYFREPPLPGTLQDLSLHGVCFLSPIRLRKGQIIKVSHTVFSAACQITHCRKQKYKPLFSTGAVFITIQFHQELSNFLDTQS